MTDKKGNQWAYLKEFKIETPIPSFESWYGENVTFVSAMPQIEFTGLAPATPEILAAIQKWMKDPGGLPFYQDEWMCLYCGSPNPLPERHCSQCGAPRNWLIG